MKPEIKESALLVHIEHSKPIVVREFVSSLDAIGELFSYYVQKNGECKDMAKAELYVEKVEHGSIDIYLCELASAVILPFIENANLIMEFGAHLKQVIDYFAHGKGNKPDLSIQEYKNLKDVFAITAGDNNGTTSIAVVDKNNSKSVFNHCTFNFIDSNSAQNQISKEIESRKDTQPNADGIYRRVLMTVYQIRNDNTDKGNKAIIENIFKKRKLNLLFQTDELKTRMLHSDENPTKKAFQVDIEVQTINEKPFAYKVLAIHDIMDIEDD